MQHTTSLLLTASKVDLTDLSVECSMHNSMFSTSWYAFNAIWALKHNWNWNDAHTYLYFRCKSRKLTVYPRFFPLTCPSPSCPRDVPVGPARNGLLLETRSHWRSWICTSPGDKTSERSLSPTNTTIHRGLSCVLGLFPTVTTRWNKIHGFLNLWISVPRNINIYLSRSHEFIVARL